MQIDCDSVCRITTYSISNLKNKLISHSLHTNHTSTGQFTEQPLVAISRGELTESTHIGSIAIVDSNGKLIYEYGDSKAVAFMRSSAKPIQAIPLIKAGGHEVFGLTRKEIAIICGSHSGTDEHVSVVSQIENKIGISETDLQCGIQFPFNFGTSLEMHKRGERPKENRNNCSGKHAGMIAYAKLKNLSIDDYFLPTHKLQQEVLETVSMMSGIPIDAIPIGVDGCSVPTYGLPLRNAALLFARLSDPSTLPQDLSESCKLITASMTKHADMVGGKDRFDTCLMDSFGDRVISKAGAEGYQCLGVFPEVLGEGSPGLGIAIKVIDGDQKNRARPVISMEILQQLKVIPADVKGSLSQFMPSRKLTNKRGIHIGEINPTFSIHD